MPRKEVAMTASDPIQTPVTGHENSEDQRQPLQALAKFYRALNTRNVELMQQIWDNSLEAAMREPLFRLFRQPL
jgi:hypothetical protein